MDEKQLKQAREEYEKLINKLNSADQQLFKFSLEQLEKGKIGLDDWNRQIERFQDTLDRVSSDLSFAATAFRNITEELRAGNDGLKLARIQEQSRISSLNKISNIARQGLEVRRGENFLNERQLAQLATRNDRELQNLIRLRKFSKLSEEKLAQIDEEIERTKAVGDGLKDIADTTKEIQNNLGFTVGALGGIESVLKKAGLPALGISKAIEDTQKDAQKFKSSGGDLEKNFDSISEFSKNLKENLKESLTSVKIFEVAFAAVLNQTLKLNETQTEFRRLTGDNVNFLDSVANTTNRITKENVTLVQQVQELVNLTNQFGVNAQSAFSVENVRETAELVNLFGLSADAAGNLAAFSQTTGNNLRDQGERLFANINPALSQQKIFEQVGKTSKAISLTFGNNIELIGEAAAAAAELGLTLEQVDNIADGLLDIESSIRKEFEAEVITGKQLNLERARFAALTNDLAGLTEEIAKNEEILGAFATGNRIEQQAIADAIGLSREELAGKILQQELVNGATLEEAAARSDLRLEDAKRLNIQQQINTSVAKLGELFAPILEGFVNILSVALQFKNTLLTIASVYAGFKIATGINLAIAKLTTKETQKQAAAETAKASVSAISNPIGAIAGLAAAALVFSAAKGYLSSADDFKQEGYGKRMMFSPEGAISFNDKDTIVAGTDLGGRGGGRNQPTSVVLSDQQIKQIAEAVRDGASRATINLDGDRVSSRLQTPSVINQRQFSI